MGSRLKQNPEQTFYWFFEATCPVARDKDPGVLFQFPEDFSDEESCQTLPRFCFPYDIQRVRDGVAVQHFTFVLTDLEGCQRFGFCRLTNSTHTCLCILSYLPWFEVFYKLLNNLADYLIKGQTSEMKALLAALYKQPIPLAAGSVVLQMGEQLMVSTEVSHPVGHEEGQEGIPYFIAPDPRSLPSIPENRNLTELIVAVDVGNLLQLYASMLFERRILIFASKLSTLTSCVHALNAVLYPMYWQHIFIPVLPPHLLEYCCAPMPYLIGVHTSLSERVRRNGLEEVVILNVDTNTLETPFDDLKKIPSDVMSGLKVCLKRQAVAPGCGVSKAFLKAQALLFGGYRDALQGNQEGEMCFSEELFLDHKSPSMRQFLQSAVHLQFFKQFIDGRLDILNKGKEPEDLFEEEILKCETAAGLGKSYQHLVGNLKKGGGALILNMRSKANTRAKGLAKSGLKNLLMPKTHKEDHSLQRGGSVTHRRAQSDCLQSRLPITPHFGMSRPRRPVHQYRPSGAEEGTKDPGETWDGAVPGTVLESDSDLQKDVDEEQESPLCDSEEMDLLGEIFDTLSSRSLHERGLLYGTRSLDLFGSDSHDYITKLGFPANPSQESLALSASGSGSLLSWNHEEEPSELTEDLDWPSLGASEPQVEETENLLAACEITEKESGQEQEEFNAATNRKQEDETEDRTDFKEVQSEEERETDCQEKKESLGEERAKETAEIEEAERLKEDEQNQTDGVDESKELENGTNEMEKDVARGEEEKENQENKLTNLTPHHPEPEPPAAQDKRKEEAVKKVLSAVARFQSKGPSQSFQLKSRAKDLNEPERVWNKFESRDRMQTLSTCDSNVSENNSSEGHKEEEQEPPPIKVSELKKRFEG